MMTLFCLLVLSGGVVVLLSRSAYFSALGLVMATCGYSGILVMSGTVFMGLMLFLIYLGGMLVVFAYSAALSTDIYPEVGINKVVLAVVIGILGMMVAVMEISFNNKELEGLGSQEDLLGVANLYSDLWPSLLLGGLGLFICLFVVLHLVRGTSRGTLRAVSKSNLTECLLWGQVVEV